VKSNDDSRAKRKTISGRLSDYFGFKPSENGGVLSDENINCMTCHKAFAYHGSNTSLITTCNMHMTAHPIHVFSFFNYNQLLINVNF